MKYYAKTNTGDPKTGFISMGETLTKAQMDALGKDKLDELVNRDVLGVLDADQRADDSDDTGSGETVPPNQDGNSGDNQDENSGDNQGEEPGEGENDAVNEPAESDEDEDNNLPTLDVEAVVVDEAPAKPKTSKKSTAKGGRSK